MAICRDPAALAAAMNADAAYFQSEPDAQKNLTLEFSRRARGIAVWAALRTLGRTGLADMIERHRSQARRFADGLRAAGFDVLNRVVLNQVLVRGRDDAETAAMLARIQASGETWCSGTRWQGRAAFRVSVSSWRTTDADVERALRAMVGARG